MSRSARSPLVVIFLTVFLDLVGFGIIIPLSPFLAREFQASPLQIGLLMSIYSIFQFVFSPIWGSWSDRIGRRPVILISLLGSALSYLLFAFSDTLLWLFIARGLAGAFGGNISAAQAYIADVTSAQERSKGMGLIGAAFGLGFVVGPLLGGLLGWWGQKLGSAPPLGLSFSALGAAVLCGSNWVMAYFVLRESLPPDKRSTSGVQRGSRWKRIYAHLRKPLVGPLIWVFFLSGLAMAQMEAMLFPYVADQFGWDLHTSSLGFAYVGVLMVITQGYLIRKVMPKIKESRLLFISLVGFALSLTAIAFAHEIWLLAVVMTVLAIANGFMRPPNLGLISVLTPENEQGITMGVTQSLASLGRILGPLLGGFLYQKYGTGTPFVSAGLMALFAAWIVLSLQKKLSR